jgi:putative ABC transport system permease protein
VIESFWQDVRYAGRTFVRAPGFVIVAVLTIAIGVGANAAIFTVVNATMLRPLPYPRSSELVLISETDRQTRQVRQSAGPVAPANFLDWRVRNHSFTGVAGFESASLTLTGGDRPEGIVASMVNANFFDVLEMKPALGRTFIASDEGQGAPRTVILSDALWRERFGGRPDAIGQSVAFDDQRYTVIGVMGPGVVYPGKSRAWITPHWLVPDDRQMPPDKDPSTQRGHTYFLAVARLKPGVAVAGAAADMDTVAATMERDFPDTNQNAGVRLSKFREDIIETEVQSTTLLLFGAVGLLLLIATANVSGLLLARATARQQEISLRVALGATRGRIVTQLLTESLLLAAIGGGAGVLLAMWLVPALVSLSPADLRVAGDVAIDRNVLLFGLAVSTLSGLLFGLAPARQLSGLAVNEELKQSARGAVSPRQRRIRAVLVAGEIALSLVLLVAAGLTVRSFVHVQRVPGGFNPDRILTVGLSPAATRYPTQARRAQFWEQLVRELRQIPGVEAAAAVSRLPLLPGNSARGLTIKELPPSAQPTADYRTASPDYFTVMSIPVLRGRVFEDADREGRPVVAVVSQSAAQAWWPGRDPIGQHFQILVPGPVYSVVGVVGDVHSASLEAPIQPTIYVPYRQDAFPSMVFVMRTPATAAALANQVRAAVWRVDKDQPVGAILTMDDQLSRSLQRRRFSVTLFSVFGVVAVLLAAVGLYGVLAFIVSQRRREIGVRMALGATSRDVIGDVLGQGLRLAGLGMFVGVVLSLAMTRVLSAVLFATSPTDAATFAGAAALLAAITVLASLVPALRASHVDPLVALRDE